MGDVSDVDMTAMALTALASYQEETDVKAAVDAALTYLSDAQQADGGFMSWGESNSESCAQVIVMVFEMRDAMDNCAYSGPAVFTVEGGSVTTSV